MFQLGLTGEETLKRKKENFKACRVEGHTAEP